MAKSILRVPLRFSSTLSHLRIRNVVIVAVARFILPSAAAATTSTSTPVKRTNERSECARSCSLALTRQATTVMFMKWMADEQQRTSISCEQHHYAKHSLSVSLSLSLALAPIRDSSGRGRNMSVQRVCVCVRTINAIVACMYAWVNMFVCVFI